MKYRSIDPLAAKDIRDQIDKVLRGLGNPDPPLDLRIVRELLRLDRTYYSATNTGALQEYISKIKVGAKQLAMRPTLILDVVRKAGLKALWIPDRKRIFIDESIPDLKKRNAEAHEITHSITPHHKLFLFGDNSETLSRSCYEILEGEANYGSSQLLFLRNRFTDQAYDLPRSLGSVRDLAKVFGNTITMTLWRLIEEAPEDEALFGVVSAHPHHPDPEFDPTSPCRHFVESPAFRVRFSTVPEIDVFQTIRSYASRARGGKLGEKETAFRDCNGQPHWFHMETFFNGFDALTLGKYLRPVESSIVIPAKYAS